MAVNWDTKTLANAQELCAIMSPATAAAQLGTTADALGQAFKRAGLRSPSSYQIAPGQRLRGNSTLLDASGDVERKWVKTERDSDDPPDVPKHPEGFTIRKVSTLVDSQGQVRAQWTQANQAEQMRFAQFNAAIAAMLKDYQRPGPIVPAPESVEAALLSIIVLGDPHVAMLAWHRETGQNFDTKIAEKDLCAGVDMLVERSPRCARGLLANVGDFFHAEDDKQLTPGGGNKLDVDCRSTKVFESGCRIHTRMVERMLEKHKTVLIANVPGNHDPKNSRMLNEWCKAWWRNEPRVEVLDNADPFIYVRHGKCLIGLNHGQVKDANLPGIMAADRAEDWGQTLYRMWLTGHNHHKVREEFPGCSVEHFNTMAPGDYWHHDRGYRASQSMTCMTLDREWGELTRSMVDVRKVRSHA